MDFVFDDGFGVLVEGIGCIEVLFLILVFRCGW